MSRGAREVARSGGWWARGAGAMAVVLPGLLLAATGVGAGDLATGAIVGARLGMAVAWAVVVGALIKFVLTEGVARYQLSTGNTILEGMCLRLGPVVPVVFGVYLVLWSLWVGRALMAACGATATALVPLGVREVWADGPLWFNDRNVWGVVHSLAGMGLVLLGSFRLFARIMAGAVCVMFVSVIATAVALRPDPMELLMGLVVPRIPDLAGEGLGWTIALMGGVGGTLTVICYSYWMREAGRSGLSSLRVCRIDLAVGYVATGLFGVAMITIAARLGAELSESGASLVVGIGLVVGEALGAAFGWVFLVGAWAAMFSSLLGVWQAVPYVFADYVSTTRHGWGIGVPRDESLATRAPSTRSPSYRLALVGIATVPSLGLAGSFAGIQQVYAVFGAAFIPFLGGALLVLNSRRRLPGGGGNGAWTTALLVGCVALAVLAAGYELLG